MVEKILIVDDEKNLRLSLQNYFLQEGYKVDVAENSSEALSKVQNYQPDLIILDIQLPPPGDGLEICRQIRQERGQDIGIIMISGSKKDTIDRVVGLELGADVYMLKPFEPRELLAQVKALLRRRKAKIDSGDDAGWFIVDEYLRINVERRLVQVNGKNIHLSKLEFDLLVYLFEHAGIPCGRADLIDNVWGYEAGWDLSDAAINTCIARLRKQIEPDPENPEYILSVHGIGYRFKELS